jgi:hypothetical protein
LITADGLDAFVGELHPEVITAESIRQFSDKEQEGGWGLFSQALDQPIAISELTISRVL